MKKLLFILFIFIIADCKAAPSDLFSYSSLAPKKKSTNGIDKTRILIGPGIGFGAAQRAFSFNISPSVAYCLTDDFNVGATLGFNYFQQNFDYRNILYGNLETYHYKSAAYSLSVFARYLIGNFLILNVEPEINNTKFLYNSFNSINDYDLNTGKIKERSTRLFIPSFLIGGGYAQRIGEYGYSYMMACYDLIQNPNARYYQTLDIRVGIMINFW